MYLEISSQNEMAAEAVSLIGNSTKRGDNTKTGYFGSGCSYSIASMLNQNIGFKIFSGLEEIEVSTQDIDFRGTPLKQIYINGEKTSLTTTMGGKDWQNAFAPLREIYSNALDEDKDTTLRKVSTPNPQAGFTKFYIELTPAVQDFYDNLGKYFSNRRQDILATNTCRGTIFKPSENLTIYRKGILAHSDKTSKAIFDYNLLNIKINESRVVESLWEVRWEVSCMLKELTDRDLITKFLYEFSKAKLVKKLDISQKSPVVFETELSWSHGLFSPEWREVVSGMKIVPDAVLPFIEEGEADGALILPYNLCQELKNQFKDLKFVGMGGKDRVIFVESEPSQELLDKVIDAITLLNKTDYKKRLKNPVIKYGKFGEDKTYGMADNNEIYLSVKLELESVELIAKIIMEENEHNITNYNDETRAFQNHWIALYYNQLIK